MTKLRRLVREYMEDMLNEVPQATMTDLAEAAAIGVCRDQWLDDETHWVWELAQQVKEQKNA